MRFVKQGALIGLALCVGMVVSCKKTADTEEVTPRVVENKVTEGMILVPGGEFIMGSDEVDKEMLQQRFGMRKIPYQNEHPLRKESISDFYIDKYEVTNNDYKIFVDATSYVPPVHWPNGEVPERVATHPVSMVSWYNGDAYCRWKGKTLPTEIQWEKAARGTDGRKFVWGNEFAERKANILGLNGGTTPAGQFKEDVSPSGVYEMGGNVSEWVINWYQAYPGNDFGDPGYGKKTKVLRGGSWGGIGHYSFELFYRTTFRNSEQPDAVLNDVGFRCAYSEG